MSSKGQLIAQLFSKAVANTRSFDQNLRKVKVITCGQGMMTTQFQVGPEHLNQIGTLHGAFIAHLVDAISTYALTTNERVNTRGVSVDLSISYMNSAKEGDCVEVTATTKKAGKQLAFLDVEVRNKENGKLLAVGKHTKYIGDNTIPLKLD